MLPRMNRSKTPESLNTGRCRSRRMASRIQPLAILAVLLLISGCMAPPSTPDSTVPEDVAPVESVLVEERFDMVVSGINFEGNNFGVPDYPSGHNAVMLQGFAGTNITSVHARVDYAPVATSTGVYALKAGLSDDRCCVTVWNGETVGNGPLELELLLADLWTDRQGDLDIRIRLWPHGDVAMAYGQEFSMVVSVNSTDPEDRPPEMYTLSGAG